MLTNEGKERFVKTILVVAGLALLFVGISVVRGIEDLLVD